MNSTNYWKCVLNFPPTWLANWQWLFEQANHGLYLISWYTSRGPEQQFWHCFTDRLLEVLVLSVVQAMDTATWKLNQGQMTKQGERGWGKECSLSAFFDFFLSPPSQSFSHSTPYSTWFKFGVAGGHPTKNYFYISFYYINQTFQVLKTVRVLILAVFMVHPDKQKWY